MQRLLIYDRASDARGPVAGANTWGELLALVSGFAAAELREADVPVVVPAEGYGSLWGDGPRRRERSADPTAGLWPRDLGGEG